KSGKAAAAVSLDAQGSAAQAAGRLLLLRGGTGRAGQGAPALSRLDQRRLRRSVLPEAELAEGDAEDFPLAQEVVQTPGMLLQTAPVVLDEARLALLPGDLHQRRDRQEVAGWGIDFGGKLPKHLRVQNV